MICRSQHDTTHSSTTQRITSHNSRNTHRQLPTPRLGVLSIFHDIFPDRIRSGAAASVISPTRRRLCCVETRSFRRRPRRRFGRGFRSRIPAGIPRSPSHPWGSLSWCFPSAGRDSPSPSFPARRSSCGRRPFFFFFFRFSFSFSLLGGRRWVLRRVTADIKGN